MFGSLTVILTVLLLGFPEHITEDLVVAWSGCFSGATGLGA
ncbi:MAG: hypothetical protein ACREXR_16570 [Gammaproteobacteria bacterium]